MALRKGLYAVFRVLQVGLICVVLVTADDLLSPMMIAGWVCLAVAVVAQIMAYWAKRRMVVDRRAVDECDPVPDEAERAELIRIRDDIGLVPAVRAYRERHPGVGLVESKRMVEAL